MEWNDYPAMPGPLVPAQPGQSAQPVSISARESSATDGRAFGLKRTVLTAAVSAMLLVGGAAAAVSAASPDPAASSAPSTTTPSTQPNRTGGSTVNCPNMGNDGSSGSSGGTTTPSPAATPQT
jgi:hypothetical protein